MEHERRVTVNADNGLTSIHGVMVNSFGQEAMEWNGCVWKNLNKLKNNVYIQSILEGLNKNSNVHEFTD